MSPGVSADPPNRTSIREVLDALDADLASTAYGVADGLYAFWLGSGISRDAVPGLGALLTKVLTYLQHRVDPADPTCRYREALAEILHVGGVPQVVRDSIDWSQPVPEWPNLSDVLDPLTSHYSRVMEVDVDGEADEDFLLWEAADVRATYADTSLVPDAEHLCLAILILEGAVSTATSANWDGLVEAAVDLLAGPNNGLLRVRVHDDDFRGPDARCELIKFHGCAVQAARDPDKYRSMLVVRDSQITGWIQSADHRVAVGHLTHLVARKPTLMIGLSAQDADIQEIFVRAQELLAWPWPAAPQDPTAMVFCEETVGFDQTKILKFMYRDLYRPNRAEILKSARVGSFAKPFLIALVLSTLTTKLVQLLDSVNDADVADAELNEMKHSLRMVVGTIADTAGANHRDFVIRLVQQVSLILTTFRTGVAPTGSDRYEPLTAHPVRAVLADPNAIVPELRWLAIALSLLAAGTRFGWWSLDAGDVDWPEGGVLQLTTSGGSTKVFILRDALVLGQLEAHGRYDAQDSEVLAIVGTAGPSPQRRSPSVSYGRTGRISSREVSVESMVHDAPAGTLLERFRQEVGA